MRGLAMTTGTRAPRDWRLRRKKLPMHQRSPRLWLSRKRSRLSHKSKVKQPAGQNQKAQAKRDREALRAATRAKVSKPALQEQAPDSLSQKVAEVAPAVVPSSRANQPLNDTTLDENLVATAVTAWPVLPNVEAADASALEALEATAVDSEAAKANAVQLVDPNEINDLDRAAAVSAETSWITSLLLILGAALAAASAVWFFSRMTPMFARRAANPRLRMSNS